MSEKMTIHRALAELKLTDARIHSAISDGVYCAGSKRSSEKLDGLTIDEYKAKIQGSFDKVNALIERRKKIKDAIVTSNATTKVVIGGKEMTVAEAIERKNSIQYDRMYLNKVKNVYTQILGKVNKENEMLPQKLETYLQSILGSKDKAKPEEVEQHTKLFMDRNTLDFIDPCGIEAFCKKLEEEITTFATDVDATLSESNAVTFIEI